MTRLTTQAERLGYGPGWPTKRTDMVKVEAGGIRLWVHPVLEDLTIELVTRTALFYPLNPATCGSYSCRPKRGTESPSEHSNGTANDLNWDRNPMRKPLTTDIPSGIIDLWEAHGYTWGGRWKTPDPMHFQIKVPPSKIPGIVESLRASAQPPPGAEPSPSPVTDEGIRKYQYLLIWLGRAENTLQVSGYLDTRWTLTICKFQQVQQMDVTGVLDDHTRLAIDLLTAQKQAAA